MNRIAIHASVLLLFAASTAWGQVQYNVTDLGTLSGGTASSAAAINNYGQVAGTIWYPSHVQHAFLYSNGQMTDLGTLNGSYSYAAGINDSGQVVGGAGFNQFDERAYLYSNGQMTNLGTLGDDSNAESINDSGQIAGSSDTSSAWRPFLYSNGRMTNLGTLPGYTDISYAYGINNSGQVVGVSINSSGVEHAFLYSNGRMTDLGTLGGNMTEAYKINSSGEVVGTSRNSSGVEHAFLYSNGTMTSLGALPAPYNQLSYANGINDSGQVVGVSGGYGGSSAHAFLWSTAGGMQDLSSLIGSSGWDLEEATAINNNGDIVGSGVNPAGQVDAFLLTPISAPAGVVWTSAVNGNWSDSSKWAGSVPNGVGAAAAFSAATTAPITVTLDVPVTLGSLQFGNTGSASTGYTLVGSGTNTLTFSNSGNGAMITVTDGTHAINTPVILADNLKVTSGGTNSWTLSFGAASNITDNGGGYSLTMNGAGGSLILSGSNTYTGGTTVNAGALTFLNRAAQPAAGTTTVAAGATLGLGVGPTPPYFGSADLDALFAGTMSNVASDPNSNVGIDTTAGNFTYASNIPATTIGLTKLGANTLTLTGSNSYAGLTTISGGTLQLGDGTAGHDGSVAGNIVDNAALVYNLNSNRTYAGVINGFGSVTKTGPGTLTLTNLNTYAGATMINGGTLKLQPVSGANASLVGFWSGNGNASDSTGNNPGTLVNGVSFAPGLNGQKAFSFSGSSYVQAGTQGLPTGNQNRTIDLWFNETSPIAQESFLAGYGGFGNYNQAYEIFINNNNSTPGQVAFSQWGTGVTGPTIQDGQWYNLAVTTSGGLSTLYLNGKEVSSGSVPINTPSDTAFYIGTIGNSYGYGSSYQREVNGLIQDVAVYNTALSQSEIQALMGSETPNLLPTTTVVTIAANATLDLGGGSQQVASLSGAGSILNSNTGASVLTLSPTGGTTTFSGMIQGGGTLGTISLVMSGSGTQVLAGSILGPESLTVNAGTLILSASNTYNGGTAVNGGTLIATSAYALPGGTSLTVGARGTFIFDPSTAGAPAVGSQAQVAAVPEPGTLMLLAVGTFGLLGYALRRRKRSPCPEREQPDDARYIAWKSSIDER